MNPSLVAKQILAQEWDHSLPVNPVTLADRMGIRVFSADISPLGGYYVEEEKAIVINSDDSQVRQRFSVAHELGHHVLMHGSSPRSNEQKYTQSSYIPKEYEANAFAAELLMPEEAVRAFVEQKGASFEQMLDAFGVSRQALTIRLQTLGYI